MLEITRKGKNIFIGKKKVANLKRKLSNINKNHSFIKKIKSLKYIKRITAKKIKSIFKKWV